MLSQVERRIAVALQNDQECGSCREKCFAEETVRRTAVHQTIRSQAATASSSRRSRAMPGACLTDNSTARRLREILMHALPLRFKFVKGLCGFLYLIGNLEFVLCVTQRPFRTQYSGRKGACR